MYTLTIDDHGRSVSTLARHPRSRPGRLAHIPGAVATTSTTTVPHSAQRHPRSVRASSPSPGPHRASSGRPPSSPTPNSTPGANLTAALRRRSRPRAGALTLSSPTTPPAMPHRLVDITDECGHLTWPTPTAWESGHP